jgi:quercetin dioxygenase-like cupin family protein
VTASAAVEAPDVVVLREGLPLDVVEGGGRASAIIWPGMGSRWRSMHRIELDAGASTIALRHEGEAVYCVASGRGRVGDLPVQARSMIFVPPGASYRIEADEPMLVCGGPCPPDGALYADGARTGANGAGDGPPVRVLDPALDGVPLPMIGKQVRLVVWPGMGAEMATMNFAVLEPGEENVPHTHEESDDVIAVFDGLGSIDDLTNGQTHEFRAGDVVFVRAGVHHKVKADRGVALVSAGGPCPPDYGMLRALGLA